MLYADFGLLFFIFFYQFFFIANFKELNLEKYIKKLEDFFIIAKAGPIEETLRTYFTGTFVGRSIKTGGFTKTGT